MTHVVSWYNESKYEETNDVEEGNAPEDLLGSLRQSLSGVGSFGSSKTNKLSTTESKGSSNKDTAEALETVDKSSGLVPVFCANVTTSISGNTTNIDDDTKDDETDACNDLDDRKNEFDLTIGADTEELDGRKSDKENGNPDANVDASSTFPEIDGDRGSSKFERQDS